MYGSGGRETQAVYWGSRLCIRSEWGVEGLGLKYFQTTCCTVCSNVCCHAIGEVYVRVVACTSTQHVFMGTA